MDCIACKQPLPETAKFCPECGQRVAAADDGERRHATIVFSDLSGYTALNECLDPEEVEAIMGRIKQAATRVVFRHGGVINQFVGDEVVALFGIPVAHRDDAVRAVRAASDLHQEVRAIAAELAPRIGRVLTMHSGINTGLIVARRSDSRDGSFALTGDVVNTAARLLHLAQGDEIVVGQDTWREVQAEFEGEAGTPTEVRGKERPIVPWRIRGQRTIAQRALRPLIGRGEEVAGFERYSRSCLASGRGGVIVLRGDAGIGKSRLAAEFLLRAARMGYATHRALVLDFGAERGRDALRALARELAGERLSSTLSPEREVHLAELVDGVLRPEQRAMVAAMTPTTRERGVQEALLGLAREAARSQARLLLVEDVHWADDWTLARLIALAALAREARLLLVATTRHENDPGARFGEVLALHDLRPLAEDEMAGLAEQYAKVPPALARRCIERAEGNPLFLEQLLLNADESAAQPLPGSIQGLVLQRMDRLPAADRNLLQAAAVLGQRFSLDALRHLLGDPHAHCRVLLDQNLVRTEGEDFLFWHALIRDGAYESMLKSRRRQLHVLAAEWFEARDAAHAAAHYDRAGDERAPEAYLKASDQESARYRFERALGHALRGLEVATDPAQKAALLARRARILLDLGRARESIEAWQSVLAADSGDAQRCQALIGIAAGLRIVERVEEGLAVLAQAEPLARAHGLHLESAQLHGLRGNFYFGISRAADCLREHQAALASALLAGSAEAEANALSGLGDAHYVRGHMRSALEHFSRCVVLAERHGYGAIQVSNLHMVGWSAYYLMRLPEALATVERAAELARTVAHPRSEMIAQAAVGLVAGYCRGEFDLGEQRLWRAIGISRALGARRFESQQLTMLAMISLRRGDRAAARAGAAQALEICRAHGMDFFGPITLGLCARLAEDADERRRLEDEAIALLDAGAAGHSQVEFGAMAVESAIERGAFEEIEAHCARMQRFMRDEMPPLCDFLVRRGRALAARALGWGSAAEISALADEARAATLDVYLVGLEPR